MVLVMIKHMKHHIMSMIACCCKQVKNLEQSFVCVISFVKFFVMLYIKTLLKKENQLILILSNL